MSEVIDHRKTSLNNIVDFMADKTLDDRFELRLKKRLGIVKDGHSEKEPDYVFPVSYSINFQMGHFISKETSVPGCRIRFHHSLLNKSAYENWHLDYIKEVLGSNKVMSDLVTRMRNSLEMKDIK